MRYPAVGSKTALVTGCSTGIGLATARMLKQAGWQVVPTARKPRDLERLRGEGFQPVRLDAADPASVPQAAREALELLGGKLGALVNNAGFGQPGALEDLSRHAMRYQFEVNVFGLQELANLCLPVMRRQGWGRIVNVSSVLGRIPLPYMGIYCASKYAVEALSDTLRLELRGSGIAVAIIEPGPIATEFRTASMAMGHANLGGLASAAHADYYRRQAEAHAQGRRKPSQAFTAPPEAVAKKILHALESSRPRRRYPVTFPAYVGSWMARLAPAWLLDRLLGTAQIR